MHRPNLCDGLRWPRFGRTRRLTCFRGGERQTALAHRLARADAGGEDKCRCNRQHGNSSARRLSAIIQNRGTHPFREQAEHRRARGTEPGCQPALRHQEVVSILQAQRSSSVRRLLSRGRRGAASTCWRRRLLTTREARPSVEVPVPGAIGAGARSLVQRGTERPDHPADDAVDASNAPGHARHLLRATS